MAIYVDITSGLRGYFAVLVDDSDGFPEALQTGIGSYKTREEAESEARVWAMSEEIPFGYPGLDLAENGPKDGPVEIDYGAF